MKLNYILILVIFLYSCAVKKHDYYKNISNAHYFNALCTSYVKDEIEKQTLDPDIGVIILSDLLDSKINLLKASKQLPEVLNYEFVEIKLAKGEDTLGLLFLTSDTANIRTKLDNLDFNRYRIVKQKVMDVDIVYTYKD